MKIGLPKRPERRRMEKTISVPVLRRKPLCSIILKHEHGLKDTWEMGRTHHNSHFLLIVFRGWWFSVYTKGDSYADLVGFAASVDWMIDEFDATFNEYACASLRFHLNHTHLDREDRRERWEALIERLSEKRPTFTEPEMAILEPPGYDWETDELEPLPNGRYRLRPPTPEKEAVYEAQRLREDEYLERLRMARHDFVEEIPYLWS